MKIHTPHFVFGLFAWSLCSAITFAGPYAPPAGQSGTDAIPAASPLIHGWASGVANLTRGPQNISNPSSPPASFGTASLALGPADCTPSVTTKCVSLGD